MNITYVKRAFTFLLLAATMMIFPSVSQAAGTETPSETISSFEIVTLRLSGMRFTNEYEIVMKDQEAEVVEYEIRYRKEEGKTRVPVSKAVCSADRMLTLLNDCELISWDGFHGAHPKDVRDGIMFSLKATVNGARKIEADGSENFPNHFRELWNGLDNILRSQNG